MPPAAPPGPLTRLLPHKKNELIPAKQVQEEREGMAFTFGGGGTGGGFSFGGASTGAAPAFGSQSAAAPAAGGFSLGAAAAAPAATGAAAGFGFGAGVFTLVLPCMFAV